MRLNNKGFAISSIMYIILVLATILIVITLSLLSSRKLILDRLKDEVIDKIKYSEILTTLKEEAIMYARENNIEKDSIQVSNLASAIDSNTLEKHSLFDKYLTMINKNGSYDIYLGASKTISDINKNNDSFIDIIDYKISGNSYQYTRDSRNLIPFPYKTSSNTKNGVTYTVNEDGSIHVSGTATANASFVLYQNVSELPTGIEIGKDYTISLAYNKESVSDISVYCNYYKTGATSASSYSGWFNSNSTKNTTKASPDDLQGLYCYLMVLSGKTVEGTVYPQLELGTQVTEYIQYGDMPSPEHLSEVNSVGNKVTIEEVVKYEIPITVSGKNLFDTKNAEKYSGSSTLQEQNSNEIIVSQVDASQWGSVNFPISEELVGKKVTISADIKTSGANEGQLQILWMDGELSTDLGGIISDTVSSTDKFIRVSATGIVPENILENDYRLCLLLYSNAGASLENGVEYTTTYKNIQLEISDEATEYEPYVETVTTNIYLDEPLGKIGNNIDYVSFKDKLDSRKTKKITFTGNEDWNYINNKHLLQIDDIYEKGSSGYSNYYLGSEADDDSSHEGDNNIIYLSSVNQNQVWVMDNRYTTNSDFKEYLKTNYDNGTPVVLYQPILTPSTKIVDLPKINTAEGASIIKIGTDLAPSNVEFTVIEKIRKL